MLDKPKVFTSIPLSFSFKGKNAQVLLGEERAREISPYEMSPEQVLYVAYVPCMVTSPPKIIRGVETEQESLLQNLPVLAYKQAHEKGWIPLTDKNAAVRLGSRTFVIQSISPYPFALDFSKLTDWLNSETFAIDARNLFTDAREYVTRHVDFVSAIDQRFSYANLATIWGIATHFHQAFDTFPFIKYSGPPGCGKTTANATVASISFHPVLTPDISDSGFYRIREAIAGTVAMDERDFKKKTESRFDDFLNNSFTRGGWVIRNTKDELGNIVPQFFRVFGPFSFSGVQDLPYMTTTRTLYIPMKRTLKVKKYSGTHTNPYKEEPTKIRNLLYLSRFEYGSRIAEIYQTLAAEDFNLETRGWDLAKPLIAVAKVFAPEIVPEIVAYTNEQLSDRGEDATERGEMKVLLALQATIKIKTEANEDVSKPFRVGLGAIKTTLLEVFPDEDPKYWNNRRINRYLKDQLDFRSARSGRGGSTEVLIDPNLVQDWLLRMRIEKPTEGTEATEDNPKTSSSVSSVSSVDPIQSRLDKGILPSVSSVSSVTPESKLNSNLPSTEATEATEALTALHKILPQLKLRNLDELAEYLAGHYNHEPAKQLVKALAPRVFVNPDGFLELN